MNIRFVIVDAIIIFFYVSIFFVTKFTALYVFEISVLEKRKENFKGQHMTSLIMLGLFFSALLAAVYSFLMYSSSPSEDDRDTPYKFFNLNQFLSFFIVISSIMFYRTSRLLNEYRTPKKRN